MPPVQVAKAVEIAKGLRPELAEYIEGPIQYDAAVDPQVAAVKIKGKSEVAGRANVCIFPDLNTGNNTYKVVLNPAWQPRIEHPRTQSPTAFCPARHHGIPATQNPGRIR
jgi:Phosphate acetyl/butaryl transferase